MCITPIDTSRKSSYRTASLYGAWSCAMQVASSYAQVAQNGCGAMLSDSPANSACSCNQPC